LRDPSAYQSQFDGLVHGLGFFLGRLHDLARLEPHVNRQVLVGRSRNRLYLFRVLDADDGAGDGRLCEDLAYGKLAHREAKGLGLGLDFVQCVQHALKRLALIQLQVRAVVVEDMVPIVLARE